MYINKHPLRPDYDVERRLGYLIYNLEDVCTRIDSHTPKHILFLGNRYQYLLENSDPHTLDRFISKVCNIKKNEVYKLSQLEQNSSDSTAIGFMRETISSISMFQDSCQKLIIQKYRSKCSSEVDDIIENISGITNNEKLYRKDIALLIKSLKSLCERKIQNIYDNCVLKYSLVYLKCHIHSSMKEVGKDILYISNVMHSIKEMIKRINTDFTNKETDGNGSNKRALENNQELENPTKKRKIDPTSNSDKLTIDKMVPKLFCGGVFSWMFPSSSKAGASNIENELKLSLDERFKVSFNPPFDQLNPNRPPSGQEGNGLIPTLKPASTQQAEQPREIDQNNSFGSLTEKALALFDLIDSGLKSLNLGSEVTNDIHISTYALRVLLKNNDFPKFKDCFELFAENFERMGIKNAATAKTFSHVIQLIELSKELLLNHLIGNLKSVCTRMNSAMAGGVLSLITAYELQNTEPEAINQLFEQLIEIWKEPLESDLETYINEFLSECKKIGSELKHKILMCEQRQSTLKGTQMLTTPMALDENELQGARCLLDDMQIHALNSNLSPKMLQMTQEYISRLHTDLEKQAFSGFCITITGLAVALKHSPGNGDDYHFLLGALSQLQEIAKERARRSK